MATDDNSSAEPPQNPEQQPGWVFNPSGTSIAPDSGQPPAKQPQSAAVSWTASEFLAHHKDSSWFLMVAVGAALLAALVYLLTGDIFSTAVVVIVAVSFIVFSAQKPRELTYQITDNGLYIADKFYPYASFKSFAVVQQDGIESIWFMPLKRFMPILTVYFDPKDRDKILNALSQYLPLEHRQPDAVDKLMNRLRF